MKKLAMSPIYKMGKNNLEKKTTSLEDMIVSVYWTSVKPNRNSDIPISKAFLGERVYLGIKTKGVPDGIPFLAKIYEHNKITPNKKLIESDFRIKNGFGATDPLYLEKSEKWLNLLKEKGEDNELELFVKIYGYDDSVDRGKYLRVKNSDKVVVFFIGGAADKSSYGVFFGPDKNILPAKINLDKNILNKIDYNSYYLGFEEVYDVPNQTNRVEENVLEYIDKTSSIYIVGHSLGGWNGAHLSQILSDKGYNVEMLITLDPVGEGFLVHMGSSIYNSRPKPKAKKWINILAAPSKPDQTDDVAEFGKRWAVNGKADVNIVMDINHWNAPKMFQSKIINNKSCQEIVWDSIINKIGKYG